MPLHPKKVQINAQALMDMDRFRNRLVLRSVDNFPYNCVGMIFASRRAFIDIDEIYSLLREDGYTRIESHAVVEGDIVLYKYANKPTHVALIISAERVGRTPSIRVISKWGLDAEFIHFEHDVPELFGEPAEYYTDRKRHEHIPL